MADFPQGFETKTKELEHFSLEKFSEILNTESPVSVRYHKRKSIATVDKSDSVPWCNHARYLEERPIFTLDPLFHAGCYYVQEASSMFLWHVLNQIIPNEKNVNILDLCAAPGGKSTLIADFLNNEGCLVANEVIKQRAYVLTDNIIKWAYHNTIVTNTDPSQLGKIENTFDAIIIDAPCSGEGMWRKDANAMTEWSESHVELCCSRQKRIVSDILPALKGGGHLIYSTCTYNADENINNIKWMMETYDLECIDIAIDEKWNITCINETNAIGYQFLPYKLKGEGFFISILRKKGNKLGQGQNITPTKVQMVSRAEKDIIHEWLNDEGKELSILKSPSDNIYLATDAAANMFGKLEKHARVMQTGIKVGKLNKKLFIPEHGLALSLILNNNIAKIELNLNDALDYLRKNLYSVDGDIKGWAVITFQGINLGWVKNLGNRINNYLPNEFKIRNL